MHLVMTLARTGSGAAKRKMIGNFAEVAAFTFCLLMTSDVNFYFCWCHLKKKSFRKYRNSLAFSLCMTLKSNYFFLIGKLPHVLPNRFK